MQAAHRLEYYAARGPFGMTKLFSFIKRGLLDAQKVDGCTFVSEDVWNRFIAEAPLAIDARQKRTSADAA